MGALLHELAVLVLLSHILGLQRDGASAAVWGHGHGSVHAHLVAFAASSSLDVFEMELVTRLVGLHVIRELLGRLAGDTSDTVSTWRTRPCGEARALTQGSARGPCRDGAGRAQGAWAARCCPFCQVLRVSVAWRPATTASSSPPADDVVRALELRSAASRLQTVSSSSPGSARGRAARECDLGRRCTAHERTDGQHLASQARG